jgi:diguanylate cyclase (GGDEF)-like protein/PAS domain S-box-containing protein
MRTGQTKMEENREFYKTLLDNLYDGVYYLDRNRTITFWNKGAERLTGYRGDEVIGRRCSDDILAHMDDSGQNLCELACPAQQAMDDGETRESEVYLRHKKGHRVPVLVRVSPIKDTAGRIVGAVQIFSDNLTQLKLKRRVQDLHKQSLLDPLTKVANRRAMVMYLKSRREEFQRFNWPFGVLFIDIDQFKMINDLYGHLVGDGVLKMVSRTLSRNMRPFDIIGRWGGEEFVAIIVNVDLDELRSIAERYRTFIQKSKLKKAFETIRVTVSIGATLCRDGDSVESLIDRADRLMYKGKQAGRNCVVVED